MQVNALFDPAGGNAGPQGEDDGTQPQPRTNIEDSLADWIYSGQIQMVAQKTKVLLKQGRCRQRILEAPEIGKFVLDRGKRQKGFVVHQRTQQVLHILI